MTIAENQEDLTNTELKKAMLNIRLDLRQFEQKYQQSSETFYQQFTNGKLDDSEDFILWAGIYEMLQDNKRQLEAII
jgi:spore coat polysaccharide biosynthesis protein SpsF (cytidylyltransferase family)